MRAILAFLLLISLNLLSASSDGFQIVRIELVDIEFLHLAEIQVFDSTGKDVARGKIVTMSSSLDDAIHCTDGNPGSICHTKYERGAWIELNLEEVFHNIVNVRLIQRQDYRSRIVPARVLLLDGQRAIVDTFEINQEAPYYDFETQYGKDLYIKNKKCLNLNTIRYVKVQGENIVLAPMNLNQIEVFSSIGDNLALKKPVTRSSKVLEYEDALTDGVANRLDHTKDQNLQEWFMVDLGGEGYSNIEMIRIINRKDCCQDRARYVRVYLFDESMNLLEVIPIRTTRQVYELIPSCQSLDNDPDALVRYIRVQQDGIVAEYHNINQIEAYDVNGDNLALEKKVFLSSAYQNVSPDLLVNGIGNNNGHTSNNALHQWFEVDLESGKELSAVRIINRLNCCQGRLIPAYVYLLSEERKLVRKHFINEVRNVYEYHYETPKMAHSKSCNPAHGIQYIKFQAHHEEGIVVPVNLAQIEVLTPEGVNLALNKEVTMSTKHGSFPVSNIVDGVADKFSHTLARSLYEQITVNLGQPYDNIYRIRIINRKDCCKDRARGAWIFLLDKNKQYLQKHIYPDDRAFFDIIPSCQRFSNNGFIRYVKLLSDGITRDYLNIREAEVITDGGYNIAQGRPVSQSSIINVNNPPQFFNDGNLNNLAHTERNTLHEYFEIDLEKGYSNIHRIRIYNRLDCCKDRINPSLVIMMDPNRNAVEVFKITTTQDYYDIILPKRYLISGRIKDSLGLNQLTEEFLKAKNFDLRFNGIPATIRNGYYEISLVPGTYQRSFALDGYMSYTSDVVVTGDVDREDSNSKLLVTPEVPGLRVVLQWDNSSLKDLDLAGLIDRTELVYYDNKASSDKQVTLDQDNKNGDGCEILTINNGFTKDLEILVANYSNERPLIESKAQVQIFRDNDLVTSLNVPTDNKDARYWLIGKRINGVLNIENKLQIQGA